MPLAGLLMPLTLHYLFIVHACGLLHTNCLYVLGTSTAVRDVYYSSLLYIAMCHLLLSLMCWYFFVVLFAEDKKKGKAFATTKNCSSSCWCARTSGVFDLGNRRERNFNLCNCLTPLCCTAINVPKRNCVLDDRVLA